MIHLLFTSFTVHRLYRVGGGGVPFTQGAVTYIYIYTIQKQDTSCSNTC